MNGHQKRLNALVNAARRDHAHHLKHEGYEMWQRVVLDRAPDSEWAEIQDAIYETGLRIGLQRQLEYGAGNINGDGERFVSTTEVREIVGGARDAQGACGALMDHLNELESETLSQARKILNVMVRCRRDKEARVETACLEAIASGDGDDLPEAVIFDAALDAMNYWSYICRLILKRSPTRPYGNDNSLWMVPVGKHAA